MDRLVLLITVDSLRADRVDSANPQTDQKKGLSPEIDQLAEDGVNCLDAFATGPGTRQSFPGILSSTPPLAYGGYNRLGPDRPTVAERFRAAGFETGGFHSNAQLSTEFGYDRGFNTFDDLSSGPSNKDNGNTGGDTPLVASVRNSVGAWAESRPTVHRYLKSLEAHLMGLKRPYSTATQTRRRAEQWLKSQQQDTFAWVHFMDVHVPYYPPRPFREETGCGDISNTEMVDLWLKLNADPETITADELRELRSLYDATVRYVDHEIGLLIDVARQMADPEPIIAFTSDHGDEFREHGGLTHSPQLYKELVHVPLIVQLPEQKPETIDQPVSLLDIGPTILSQVGAETDGLWGVDLCNRPQKRAVFSEVAQSPDDPNDDISRDARITACRTTEWTYIRDDLRERIELYDRTNDPYEQQRLPDDQIPPSIRNAVSEFRQQVDETSPELLEREMSESVESRLSDLGYLQE